MLKPVALLGRVDRRPAGAGAEGVQVLVNVEIAQRVRRPVDVVDPNVPREDSRRLVEGRRDAIGNLLLPVTGGVAGGEEQDNWEHGGGEATSGWTEWGGGLGPGGAVPRYVRLRPRLSIAAVLDAS